MLMSREDIFDKVQETLVDALGVDDDEVSAQAQVLEGREQSAARSHDHVELSSAGTAPGVITLALGKA